MSGTETQNILSQKGNFGWFKKTKKFVQMQSCRWIDLHIFDADSILMFPPLGISLNKPTRMEVTNFREKPMSKSTTARNGGNGCHQFVTDLT